jgi:hypothetical protein
MYSKRLLYLIGFTALARMVVGGILELSNDEVYYYLYALKLQWNYFDHPPGVGLLIRLSTLNLLFTSELFVRLGAVGCAAAGTYISFKLGTEIRNERTGWIAAILYNTSIYTSLIAGTFIIPDSPQVVFWMMALWIMYRIIGKYEISQPVGLMPWVWFGAMAGLAVMCKVHGVFIWFGMGLYVLLFAPRLLRTPGPYVGALVTLVIMSPILFWNIDNDFITYRFHSERVAVEQGSIIKLDSFAQALGGQFLYSNPVNVVLIIIALFKLRASTFLTSTAARFLVVSGLPIIVLVCVMSLFNDMLPHWSGPGFMVLSLVAAAWLEANMGKDNSMPLSVRAGGVVLGTSVVLAFLLIEFYPGTIGNRQAERMGEDDFTLDMAGWRKFESDFSSWLVQQENGDSIPENVRIVSHKWFPAAHLDYYVARPLHITLIGVGELTDLHTYFWLNKTRDDLKPGDDALVIIPSNYTVNFGETYKRYFRTLQLIHTFPVERGGRVSRYFRVYRAGVYLGSDEVHGGRQ